MPDKAVLKSVDPLDLCFDDCAFCIHYRGATCKRMKQIKRFTWTFNYNTGQWDMTCIFYERAGE